MWGIWTNVFPADWTENENLNSFWKMNMYVFCMYGIIEANITIQTIHIHW